MKSMTLVTAIAIALVAVFSVQSFADEAYMEEWRYGESSTAGKYALESGFRMSWLIGRSVENDQGEYLGQIRDALVADNGRIKYAILDQGGILGRGLMGQGVGISFVAVPWKVIQPSEHKNRLTMAISKERFAMAPSFKKTEWENFDDAGWETKVHSYYGVKKERMQAKPGTQGFMIGAHRASDLMGSPALNRQGMKLGKVKNLVADKKGHIKFVVLERRTGFLGLAGKLIPVPWETVEFAGKKHPVTIDMSVARLEQAPDFKTREWRKFDNPEWQKTVYGYYGM